MRGGGFSVTTAVQLARLTLVRRNPPHHLSRPGQSLDLERLRTSPECTSGKRYRSGLWAEVTQSYWLLCEAKRVPSSIHASPWPPTTASLRRLPRCSARRNT